LVNTDNPITEVDRDELMGVFGTVESDMTEWSQLGLAGEWTDSPVLAVCTSNDDGVVQELFKHVILGGTPLKPGVTLLKSGNDLPKMISDNPNIIAIGRYVPDGSKALYVAFERSSSSLPGATGDNPGDTTGDGTGGDAGVVPGGSKASFAPTEDNVYNGDYPLRLPFYIVYKPANKEKVRQLLQVLFGEEFTADLQAQHFMPLPDTERKRTLLELDKAK
jgi:ABC-type phosphate transport system substrate-binding protein